MSLRKAINEKCKDCIYSPSNPGTWRQQVTICSVLDCPLWENRPLSEDAGAILDHPRDKVYCLKYLDWSADNLLNRAKRGNE